MWRCIDPQSFYSLCRSFPPQGGRGQDQLGKHYIKSWLCSQALIKVKHIQWRHFFPAASRLGAPEVAIILMAPQRLQSAKHSLFSVWCWCYWWIVFSIMNGALVVLCSAYWIEFGGCCVNKVKNKVCAETDSQEWRSHSQSSPNFNKEFTPVISSYLPPVIVPLTLQFLLTLTSATVG